MPRTAEQKAKLAANQRRYARTPKGREAERRRSTSPKGQRKIFRYNNSVLHREAHRRYMLSAKGKAARLRELSKRKKRNAK